MTHDTALIATVAVGFVAALVGGLVAARLRLPPLIGYLGAGIAVGPFTPGFVADASITPQLAEIGVILLMFGVGMHFSIRDLLSVRQVAVPAAAAQIGAVTGIAFALTRYWGWGTGAGIVLGIALSVSSTVVLLRALETDASLTPEGSRLAIGWLLIEDVLMVLVLVLLPPLAGLLGGHGTGEVGGGDLAWTLGLTLAKVAAFVAVMLVVGTRLLPWLLEQVSRTGSRELFTLAVVAIALGIGFESAEFLGLSFALGAFFAGMVVNSSDHSHRAAGVTEPLQDVFAVLFFVSVGMLFDPMVLVRNPLGVLEVLGVIVLAKPIIAFATLRALRQPRGLAITLSAALGQVGEFSFLLAALGLELGLLPPEGQGVILAGALLAITLNPFALRLAAFLRR